jgi:hypothetical protein
LTVRQGVQVGDRVLVAVDEGRGTYTGRGVYVEAVRVVELGGGGLIRVEDEDGVRWLCGVEQVERVEGVRSGLRPGKGVPPC